MLFVLQNVQRCLYRVRRARISVDALGSGSHRFDFVHKLPDGEIAKSRIKLRGLA